MISPQPIGTLLRRFGFSRDPFGLREAEREGQDDLAAYFFEHPLFREVLGQASALESTVVFAGRGAGKTTFRQAIELRCQQGDPGVTGVLAVPYVEFSRPLAAAQMEGTAVAIQHHVAEILRCAVARLLESLDDVRAAAVLALPRGELATLSAYIRAYSPLFDPEDYGRSVHTLLRHLALAADSDAPLREDTSDLFADVSKVPLTALPLGVRPAAEALIRAFAQPARPLPPLTPPTFGKPAGPHLRPFEQPSYHHQVREFLDLLIALQYKGLYVLVDRLDETSLLVDPAEVVRFVQPLLSDLKLLEEPQIAFKVFLPQHMEPLLAGQMRAMRLRVKHLTWGETELLQLLAHRLQSFSAAHVDTLSVFCDSALAHHPPPADAPRPDTVFVDLMLARAAGGLPRTLIWRCRQLFAVSEARHPEDLISYADLAEAVRASVPLDDPTPETIRRQGLFVDQAQQVWRDGVKLLAQPRPKELELLAYLCAHRCMVCKKEEILLAVWDVVATEPLLNTTLLRLRKAVEPDSANPRYLITVPGEGIKLVDASCP